MSCCACASPLCSLVVVVGGFAFLAVMLYGPFIASFHDMPSAFSTLMRYPIGDFSYSQLSAVSAGAGLFCRLMCLWSVTPPELQTVNNYRPR